MQTTEKTCFKCLQKKPLEAFYKHAMMADGRLNKCKECTKKDVGEHRLNNLEKIRQYDRRRASQPHRVAKSLAIGKSWRTENPQRAAAHGAVSRAIKAGKLERLPCLICGEKAEAHHPDYERPLDVVWLCSAHHKQAHALGKKLREKERER